MSHSFLDLLTRPRAVVALICITFLSGLLRLVAFQGINRVPSDTNAFLEIVAMVHGTIDANGIIPFRIENPLYSITILVAEIFTSNWVAAARIAALVPSILIPPVMCLLAWSLDRQFWSGCIAGFFAAASWSLIQVGIVPLSDSLFILFSALSLLIGLLFLRNPSFGRACATGVVAGFAWATRGPGLFYLVAISVPLAIRVLTHLSRKGHGATFWLPQKKYLLALLLFIVAFIVSGRGPTYMLWPFTDGLKPTHSYFKMVLVDGALYARGHRYRDEQVYGLNENNTGFKHYEELRRISWMEIFRKYGKQQIYAFARNMKENLSGSLPRSLPPFFIIFLPLAIGSILLWNKRPLTETATLFLFALPYIFIIPAIQLHDRYTYPIIVVGLPLVGIGLNHMIVGMKGVDPTRRRISQGLALAIVAFYLSFGTISSVRLANEPDAFVHYRQAAQWILKRHGAHYDFNVMSRYHGMYAYLKRKKTNMPIDPIERLAKYCRFSKTRYIILGPHEITHNLYLAEHFKSEMTSIAVGMRFRVVESFGDGENRVRIIKVSEISGDGGR